MQPNKNVFEKMATLRERKTRSKDLLKPLIEYTLVLYVGYCPIRFIFSCVFCQYFFSVTITIVHLLSKFDRPTLLQYGSYCGMQIFVLINLGSLIIMAGDLNDFLKKYGEAVFPIEMMNDSTMKGVIYAIKLVKSLSFINIIFSILAVLGFMAAPDYFDKRTYLCVWIQQTFPALSSLLLLVVRWTSIPVAVVLAGSSMGWAYGSCKAIFQILVVHQIINEIQDTTIPHELRRDSALYQELVKQRMIVAIMAHEYTARFQSLASDILEVPMMLFTAGSLILGGSLMMEFYSNQDRNFGDQYEIYGGILFFSIASIISANAYLILGQSIKDESQKCNYQLCQLPWYDMNQENKKIYSIFLYRSNKNLAIANSLVRVDYDLLVKIVKSLYSLAAILARFVPTEEEAA